MRAEAIAEQMLDAVKGFLSRKIEPFAKVQRDLISRADAHGARLAELERRLDKLESGG